MSVVVTIVVGVTVPVLTVAVFAFGRAARAHWRTRQTDDVRIY